jgi:hypothetical protein
MALTPMETTAVGADTLIILSRDQASFFEFVKDRQESGGRTIVILDRRQGERRRNGHGSPSNPATNPNAPERRQSERRRETPEAALALMSVLGFMVLHRDGDDWVP